MKGYFPTPDIACFFKPTSDIRVKNKLTSDIQKLARHSTILSKGKECGFDCLYSKSTLETLILKSTFGTAKNLNSTFIALYGP